MRHAIAISIVMSTTALAGCGVETATTAATVAAARKQEIEQGRKAADRIRQKITTATNQARLREERAGNTAE